MNKDTLKDKMEIENALMNCNICKDFDDTWDIYCFCDKCQSILKSKKKKERINFL